MRFASNGFGHFLTYGLGPEMSAAPHTRYDQFQHRAESGAVGQLQFVRALGARAIASRIRINDGSTEASICFR